jgi:hypothetical protein
VKKKTLWPVHKYTSMFQKLSVLSMFKSLLKAFISALHPDYELRTALSESLVLVSMALEMELWLTETLTI